jgi:hypothetical protein
LSARPAGKPTAALRLASTTESAPLVGKRAVAVTTLSASVFYLNRKKRRPLKLKSIQLSVNLNWKGVNIQNTINTA